MKKIFCLLFLLNAAYAQTKQELTLDNIFKKPIFSTNQQPQVHLLKDGKAYASIRTNLKTGEKQVIKTTCSDAGKVSVWFGESDLKFKGASLPVSINFSDDEQKVVLYNEEERIYRHSFKANYYVYDLKSKKITEVSSKGKQLYATLSPDATKVAFVRDNNLFIKDLTSGAERQITNDGLANYIINGSSDWVYEEEFSLSRAFSWSPDSKKIAYYRFDETAVREFEMTLYKDLYPTTYKYKYPKAGEDNSVVSIHVYHVDEGFTRTMDIKSNKNQYIPRIKWTADPNRLCVLRMNRYQNQLEYLLVNASNGQSQQILTQSDNRYIDINDDLIFLENGKQFILTNDSDGFNHAYLYDITGLLIQQLTKGNWEVTSLYGVDEKTNTLYYQSTERSPLCRDIYAVGLNGVDKKMISTKKGVNSVVFNTDYSYYLLTNSNSTSPPYVSLHKQSGQQVRVLEDNFNVSKLLSEYRLSPVDFFEMNTPDGTVLNGYMIKPADFDPTKKYPVLMYVYGGPGSQMVTDSWGGSNNLWFNYLAQKGYVIACVDNRGTGSRGADFKKITYKQLGKYETSDQIEVAKWLASKNFVDPSRIGIWGWSYGGYLSSLCITKGADVFSMAIAVAPVTNWRYYDSIYTERYMQLPQDNAAAYDESSPTKYAENLKGKFLLIHGTADDNVHFQNSVMFSEALIQANKSFEQAYYPNKNHGISGGNTRFHIYSRMTDFILKNL